MIFVTVLEEVSGNAVSMAAPFFAGASSTLSLFQDAVASFKKGTAASTLTALAKIAEVLDGLRSSMMEVSVAEEHADKLITAIRLIKNPCCVEFRAGRELRVNGKDVYEFMRNAARHFQNQEWISLGKALGAMVLGLLDAKSEAQSHPKLSIFRPFACCHAEAPHVKTKQDDIFV